MALGDGGATDPNRLTEGGGTDGDSLKPREFFWDSVILYLVSIIVALSAVDALTEFIRGSGVSCVLPAGANAQLDDGDRDYINTYCAGRLPVTEYIPAFIFIHGLVIAIPHFLWLATYGGQFDYFFSVVKNLEQFKQEETGKYPKQNFDLVRQLESSFTTYERNSIFWLYIGKLLLQVIVALVSLVIAIFYFTNFNVYFPCPGGAASNGSFTTDDVYWPLPNNNVVCVYTTLKLLFYIRIADVVLIGIILCCILWGFWFCASGHPMELGSNNVARFSFQSGIQPKYFLSGFRYSSNRVSGFLARYMLLPFTSPRVSNDLDFMVLKLFRTNAGLGNVFKDIQIDLRMQSLTEQDRISTDLFFRRWHSNMKVGIPRNDLKWNFKTAPEKGFEQTGRQTVQVPNSIRGAIMGLSTFANKQGGSIVISFNNNGLSLALSRLFTTRVVDVIFSDSKSDAGAGGDMTSEQSRTELVQRLVDIVDNNASHLTVTIPQNFLITHEKCRFEFRQHIKRIWKYVERVDPTIRYKITKTSFILVGPMNEEQSTIVNLFLHTISDESCLEDGCVLVLMRPVQIAGKSTRREFNGLQMEKESSKSCFAIKQFEPIIPPNSVPMNFKIRVSKKDLSWPQELDPVTVRNTTEQVPLVPVTPVRSPSKDILEEETDEQETVVMISEGGEDDDGSHKQQESSETADTAQARESDRENQIPTVHRVNLECGGVDTEFEIVAYKFVYPDDWKTNSEFSSDTDSNGEDQSDTLSPKAVGKD